MTSAVDRTSTALGDRSPRLPMGVPTRTRAPLSALPCPTLQPSPPPPPPPHLKPPPRRRRRRRRRPNPRALQGSPGRSSPELQVVADPEPPSFECPGLRFDHRTTPPAGQ